VVIVTSDEPPVTVNSTSGEETVTFGTVLSFFSQDKKDTTINKRPKDL
jgi:hypothetical protein